MSVQFSEKSPNPQPFIEPDNMTTIDLNKPDEETSTVQTETKKFKLYSIKSLIMGIGLFILLGLCITILILLIHKSYYKNLKSNNESLPLEETSFKIFWSNKEKVIACKTSKSFEDCCYIFFKANAHKDMEKCTVQKMLRLLLQYEFEVNKRSKRQSYQSDYGGYENHYPVDYNQENMYDPGPYDVQYSDQFEPSNGNEYYQYSFPNYYDVNNYQLESPNYFQEHPNEQYGERNANEFKNFDPNLKSNLDFQIDQQTDPIVAKPAKTCPDDDCTSVINASTDIANIADVKTESGKIQISLNNTKIKLSSNLKNARVSQGDDFEAKPSTDVQISSQSRQVNPCLYPVPPFGYDPNQVYGMMPFNQNFRQPLYVINPPLYPSIQYAQGVSKNAHQVVGAGGQYFLCQPISNPTNNVVGLQGVEIRRMAEAFTLQDLVESMPKIPSSSNKSREAIDCPFGTRACSDNSKCIHTRQICDNEVNCNDASDEMKCSCKNRVGELRWCDGYLDCPNGEDEQECFGCDSDEFSCDDWSRFQRGTCVPIEQRCDGIKQCEFTGKDELDCTILSDHLGQHSFFKVSNSAGFIHRNHKGKWYPMCFGAEGFSTDVCRVEAGPTEMIPSSHVIPSNDNYEGPYLDFTPNEGLTMAHSCMRNKAAFVECPPLYCGLRLTISNPFRNTEVDISAEEFLTRTRKLRKPIEPTLGDARVVGGKPSQPTAWPWIASIYKNGVFHCGGVIINELWILTAAHCVDKFWFYYYEVQVGILRRFSYSPMEQTRWATVAIPHEDYTKRTLKNDIALMKLSKPVRFNRYVRPICLPSEATAGEDFLRGPKPNTVCVTVGWGATVEHGADPDHLREVEIPILAQCKHVEDREGDEICAGLSEGGRDACQGDSGGPLMCQNAKNRNQWYLAGIVSHGEGCARPNEPGVYTKVARYIGWVNENISGKIIGRTPLQKCPGYICEGTGKCIPKKRHCDRVVDCLFGDDEFNCWKSHDHSDFRSPLVGSRNVFGRLLDILDLNGSSEQSITDEDVISTNATQHDEDGISENDLSTSTEIKIKDRKIKENNTFENDNFVCSIMLQTIPFQEKCDKVVNCEDGTDESECFCVDYLERFHKEAICDGVIDCKDISDEANCIKCSRNEHLCRVSQKCIPSKNRCDGKPDCINSEDEWDCVALTDGRTLVFDSDLRPKQSMKGIITINRFGVWRPLCTNASADDGASIVTNVCNLLGFEEYTVFHKLSVPDKPLNVTIEGFERNFSSDHFPICSGLFVRCLNVTLDDNIHKLHHDNATDQAEIYTAPWNAIIYFDGRFRCTGTILNPHWIVTVKTCFQKTSQIDDYVAALLGKGKAHLDVEGPHEQIVLISGVAFVEESDVVVLYSPQKINFTRYVQPARITTKSRFIREQCVAIGFQDKKSKMVLLEIKKECSVGFRCFETATNNCNEKISQLWNGVITCNSGEGWYPSAVFSKINGPCGFNGVEFKIINENKVNLAMGDEVEKIRPRECQGFRCNLGECIKKTELCDGVPNCRNGEDEDTDLCVNLEECHLSTDCRNTSCKLCAGILQKLLLFTYCYVRGR